MVTIHPVLTTSIEGIATIAHRSQCPPEVLDGSGAVLDEHHLAVDEGIALDTELHEMVDANHTVEQLLGVRPEIEFLVVHPHATGEGRLQGGGDILLVASVNILAVGSVEVDLEPLVESRDGPEAVCPYAQLGNGFGITRLNDVTRGQSPTAQRTCGHHGWSLTRQRLLSCDSSSRSRGSGSGQRVPQRYSGAVRGCGSGWKRFGKRSSRLCRGRFLPSARSLSGLGGSPFRGLPGLVPLGLHLCKCRMTVLKILFFVAYNLGKVQRVEGQRAPLPSYLLHLPSYFFHHTSFSNIPRPLQP